MPQQVLLRQSLGDVLRAERMRRHMTLRQLSKAARVSLGYISEIERGQKEASSELLGALCEALDVALSDVLREVSELIALGEAARELHVVDSSPLPVKAPTGPDVVASAA